MTAEHIEDDRLQMYFDRELHPGEATIVARHVAECAACKKKLVRLERMHAMFTGAARAQATAGDAQLGDAMFAKIQAGITKNDAVPMSERLHVVSDELATHRRGMVVSIGAAFAAAVVVLVVLLSRSSGPAVLVNDSVATTGSGLPQVVRPEQPVGSSKVLHVDFGARAGTVFEVEGQQGSAVSVVWIDEDVGSDGEAP